MLSLDLQVRYFQDSTPPDVPCREENFIRREINMPLPVEQTALVLVDMWNTHFIETWLERAVRLTRDAVLPVIAAARQAGLPIVHAPSPPIAERYAQLARHRSPEPGSPRQWPPPEFLQRQGDYAAFRGPRSQPPGIDVHWKEHAERLDMSPAVEVRDEDFVIATGQQLHELAEERKILHMVYAGFATNWCILNRDYGMRAMGARGYNLILLRDATTGVEFPDTVEAGFATEIAIREVEQQIGFSASNDDFFAACKGTLPLT
jgi:nicotinamidase-related amidase